MQPKLRELWLLQRYFGPRWLAYRLGYEARRRTGLLERQTPVSAWPAQPLRELLADTGMAEPGAYLEYRKAGVPAFYFSPADMERYAPLLAAWDRPEEADGADGSPVSLAEAALQGRFRYFQHTIVETGLPPAWHANPFSGRQIPAGRHWSRVDDFAHGDIKVIWELSRFGWTYALVRAYWRTRDQRYAECFWQLVEDWRRHNPPQQGPNWGCGQEASFRVMAWVFGLYGFLGCEATTPGRVAALAGMLAISGKRIAANLGYALSQHNNHGISEGMGLWTLGSLFAEFRESRRWEEMGRSVLESQGRELIYEDGSFAQHSVVYHRLMLDDYLWALRLADLNGRPFSHELRERVHVAGEFLYQIQDPGTGRVPWYGQSDGSLILPLSNCVYADFRPVIQAVSYLCGARRRYGDGPWDEELLWLFGPGALAAPPEGPSTPGAPVLAPKARSAEGRTAGPADAASRADLRANAGGYYTLRSRDGFAFTRCAEFRHRPGQADLLHVDLWWRGQNIALDPGTFSYNAPPPWDNALARTMYHNTVTVDGCDQMDRAGRFLLVPWARGRVRSYRRSSSPPIAYLEGEHDGYQRLPAPARHRRAILLLTDEWWLVLDDLRSREPHEYRVQWSLAGLPYAWEPEAGHLKLDTLAGPYHLTLAAEAAPLTCSLVRADEHSPRGWRSPTYGCREPALSLDLVARASRQTFWTVFGPQPCRIRLGSDGLRATLETNKFVVVMERGRDVRSPLIASCTFS
jgi:hypothetical protein